MKNDSNNSNRGIGFASLLTLIFITLKLCGVIIWSWWWVLSPIWISVSLLIVIVIVVFIGAFLLQTLFPKR